ncbi:uncharacterized protein BT62DRAFT_117661 [Guyanagaster necrorhizus]|uniref:Uncharacterized protein n=1 Tax=Guyanagaster necrorhizus TaxID=856835 RepID=A0A9P8ASQ9_9AGAR|nr:uncharacterized protein BT62DRAFT_117661 [Guyanagaster necrorhizus MCA 3950]KAG7446420.1 hypothetical protein BT62DRAFT_117661 [Guyanagaster necrorhizus MCA 3950]
MSIFLFCLIFVCRPYLPLIPTSYHSQVVFTPICQKYQPFRLSYGLDLRGPWCAIVMFLVYRSKLFLTVASLMHSVYGHHI